MSTVASHDPASACPAAPDAPRRILILRSCRARQFAEAVQIARERSPRVEIVALSHPGHRDELSAAGIDRVVEIPGRRFGLFRLAPRTLRRLRSERFDEVLVPQMTANCQAHVNLYWLVAALRFEHVIVLPGDEEPFLFDRRSFRKFVQRHTVCGILALADAPSLLALLAAACVAPRPRVPDVRGRRRRVLHVISSLGVGGAQRQLAEVINRTPPDRYDLDVLVLGRSDGDFSRAWLARPDVRVMFLGSWPQLASSVLEVRRHCKERRYDLVHTWLFMANVVGVAGARLAGAPRVIASVRNLSLWKRTWYRQWWFRPADALASQAADVVTVNAQALAADHAAWAWMSERCVEVIHNGLDPSQFLIDAEEKHQYLRDAAGLAPGTPVVGTVGRLAAEKDHKAFLRVLRDVRRVHRNVHGVIVGDGPLRAELEATAAQMGISQAVTFLGVRRDVRRLMAGFDVFLLTSAIEGFPNVLLEAAFLGVPAVASRVGGSSEVLRDRDATYEPGRERDAVASVLAALSDPAAAAERAGRTRRRALDLFTADRMADAWFALYDRCLSEETFQ